MREERLGLEGILNKKETRREFIKDVSKIVGGLVAEEVGRHVIFDIAPAKAQEAQIGNEIQIDLPPETYLSSLPDWQLKMFRKVPEKILELYNGPKSTWSTKEFGGVFIVPEEYFDGKTGADNEAVKKLKTRLVIRADVARDEKVDKGWGEEDLKLIQTRILIAMMRCEEFLGPSVWKGLIRIIRPSAKERAEMEKGWFEGMGGATFGGPYQCSKAVDVGKCNPDNIHIVILKSLETAISGLNPTDKDKARRSFINSLNDLLAHEIGHVWFGLTQLGTRGELGAIDNHTVITVLGKSTMLAELARRISGRRPEELNIDDLDLSDSEKSELILWWSFPEILLWKAFKVNGKEYYADLMQGLRAAYGDKGSFETTEVVTIANKLFKEVGFKFTYEEFLKKYNVMPEESQITFREMSNFKYPVERVTGDPTNPNGLVCWWEEVKVLGPVPYGKPIWFRGPIFPDADGYYRAYRKLGVGSLKDGPPNKNSLAVATWKRGGGLNNEVPFPPDQPGTEFIRAKKS